MFLIPIIVSVFSLIFTYFLTKEVNKYPSGEGKQAGIAAAIKEGAKAYLNRQYRTIGIVALFLFVILWLALGFKSGLGFLVGAAASAFCGFAGMMVSTSVNVKVTEAAKTGLKPALSLSFKGGAVTGFLVVGLGLFSVSLFYFLFSDFRALIALCFGASLIAIFSRLGGGIYTKAADVGADLVGKIEKNIPEDDPRNPAVIADQVGDNVGDCAGTAGDMFQTYVITLSATMILGALIFSNFKIIVFPLVLSAIAILSSIIGIFFVKMGKSQNPINALYKGLMVAGFLSALGFYFAVKQFNFLELGLSPLKVYFASLVGLLVASGIMFATEYYTSKKHKPVKSIAQASQSGHATNIITGLAVGMRSTVFPILLIVAGILISYWLAGIYGIAVAAIAMLSLAGLIIAFDSYGSITDNAGGIAEMAGLPKEVREITDALDAVGNTTKAVTKGYAIASSGLAALVLFAVYVRELAEMGKSFNFYLDDPLVLAGLFIGGLLPYLFASLAMSAVGKTAMDVVEEARRQFREIKDLIKGESKPEYAKCVDIVTRSAIKKMIVPALIPVFVPILVGLILGAEALGGLLIGSIVSGLFVAISMTSGGAAWDNAKKYIEEGNFGGKGSFAHQAAVTGDTVGDPYKDTAGPAINPMIKVLNIVALLMVSFLV